MTRKLEKYLEMESMRLRTKVDVDGEVEGGFYNEAQISGLEAGYSKHSILD